MDKKWFGKMKAIDHLGYLGIDGRILIKTDLREIWLEDFD
jgi:hypothetical protein